MATGDKIIIADKNYVNEGLATKEAADATILKEADIGIKVITHSEPNTFTAAQRTSISAEDNVIDFTTNNNFTLTATAAEMGTPTVAGCVGQGGVIVITDAENITGWDALYKFKEIPTDLTGIETFAYFIESSSSVRIGVLK